MTAKLSHVPAADRARLRSLFEGFPGLHGLIDSVLEGVLGEAWADELSDPSVAYLELDFHLLAGDPASPASIEALRSLPSDEHLATPASWSELVTRGRHDAQPYERFAFDQPERWDRARLAELRSGLPAGFVLERITAGSVAAFEELAESPVYNFASHEDFLESGIGFGIRHNDRFVAGCSSFAISSRSLEFEIQTHPDFQWRGLALVTGARMIEHCLDQGLEPCWDAAHEGSARLAERLGFGARRPYMAYRLGRHGLRTTADRRTARARRMRARKRA
jgi:GNAT superfamily N-acetyltransferase